MNLETIHTKNLRWIDIINPGSAEIKWLKANFRFLDLHFEAVAQNQLRPHIDQGDGYDFMVLLFPVYEQDTQEILPGEVDFFVGDNFLITAHYGQIHTLKYFFDENKNTAEKRNENMQKGAGFLLYKVLQSLFRRSYPILDHMTQDMDQIETGLFHRTDMDLLSKIALMKKNIIVFRKMMKTHHYVLEKLPRRNTSYLTFAQSKLYYKDVLEYSENIWDILDALKETADTLYDTNQALAASRLNRVTKIISIFSAIALPATLVAFIFGIGVEGIPFRHHPQGFWIVLGIMALVSLLTLTIFKSKKWF